MKKVTSLLPVLVLLAAALFLIAGLVFGFPWLDTRLLTLVLISILAASGMLLAARLLASLKQAALLWIIAGLLLFGMLVPASTWMQLIDTLAGGPFGSPDPLVLAYLLVPTLAIPVTALLLAAGFRQSVNPDKTPAGAGLPAPLPPKTTPRAAAALVLASILLAAALYKIYWLLIWDSTYDPLGWFWLVFPLLASFFAGIVLSMAAPARPRLVGIGYALLLTALLVTVNILAQRVDFRQLTEQRAGQVSRAVEAYHARHGGYPQDLRQLVPAQLLVLPEPVILYGQGWCYQAGSDFYRLAYVTRQHWSDPRLSGQVYKMAGDVSGLPPACQAEVTAMQARYPGRQFSYWPSGD